MHLLFIGKPRYLPMLEVLFKFKAVSTSFCRSNEQLLEKQTFDLNLFIFYPESEQKLFIIFVMVLQFSLFT